MDNTTPREVTITYFIKQAVSRYSAYNCFLHHHLEKLIEETKNAYNICVDNDTKLLKELTQECKRVFE